MDQYELKIEYENWLLKNQDAELSFEEWLTEISDWDVTLMDGLENEPPYISDDFQIGPDGAYEHTEKE